MLSTCTSIIMVVVISYDRIMSQQRQEKAVLSCSMLAWLDLEKGQASRIRACACVSDNELSLVKNSLRRLILREPLKLNGNDHDCHSLVLASIARSIGTEL
mmetsp:Transcript_1759/g.2421  ORF Transcript_1759/g.2421 Transcript_1759/m.2421 type:complete len:101 (-) Transcript_1759:9-311(-)